MIPKQTIDSRSKGWRRLQVTAALGRGGTGPNAKRRFSPFDVEMRRVDTEFRIRVLVKHLSTDNDHALSL